MNRNVIAGLWLVGLGLVGACSGGGNTALTTVPTAHLAITLPTATVVADTPFTFTVTALNAATAVVPTYVGTVHITTSDPSAVLPADATLTRGVGTFTVAFNTPGSQTITAGDTVGDAASGTSPAVSVKPIPAPTISSLSPTKAGVGTAGFTLIVNGANFVLHSVVHWNGSNRSTVFVSSSQVSAQISAADIATAGTAAVTVLNPAPGGGGSNASPFTVTVTVSLRVSIHPAAVTLPAGISQAFTATVEGASNNVVIWSVQEGAAGGSITNAGVYTAPQTVGTYHVIAVSQADASKSAVATVTVVTPPPANAFKPTGSMAVARGDYTATPLLDGSVLVVGGCALPAGDFCSPFTESELYDPAKGAFTSTGSMARGRAAHTATRLPDGKVLVAGGWGESPNPEATAELYDPSTRSFSRTGNLGTARTLHTATLLQSGKVLIVGGGTADGSSLATAELYDPGTGSFSPTTGMPTARRFHSATLLQNGKVLIAGGENYPSVLASAVLYDPSTDKFTPTGTMVSARSGHTATRLLDGRVLVVGGSDTWTSAELYDPKSGSFMATGSMAVEHNGHSATLLLDGRVLVTGGVHAPGNVLAELFDPAGGVFVFAGTMAQPRALHTATLLADGRVLVAGGCSAPTADGCIQTLATAELYQ
jgi:Galactose oxidase, central domain